MISAYSGTPDSGTKHFQNRRRGRAVFAQLRLDSLPVGHRVRYADVETLKLFATVGRSNFQFEWIDTVEILDGAIKRDQCRHLDREALLQVGCLEQRALDPNGAVLRRNGESDRGQRTETAIGANAGVNPNTRFASCRNFNVALDRVGLRIIFYVVFRIVFCVVLGANVILGAASTAAKEIHVIKTAAAQILVASFRAACAKIRRPRGGHAAE